MLTFVLYYSPSSIDVQFVDYDGVQFRLVTSEKKTKIHLSMSIRCWDELIQYGAWDIIQREYGPYVASTDPGYNVTLAFDTANIPQGGMSPQLQTPLTAALNWTDICTFDLKLTPNQRNKWL